MLLLGAGLVLFGLGIGAYPLWDPGEGRNAETAREMAAGGRWLVPLLYGEPYYDKPAPFFALLRAFQALLGESELALRLPSVTASLGTLLLLHRFAVPRFGRRVAALAGVIYLTSPEVVVLARFCNFDATLGFLVTAAVVAWLGWLDERRGFPWPAWVAMGLGVLIKGPVAIVLPLLIAAVCAQRRGVLAGAARAARPGRGLLVLAAIVLPWLLPAAVADPDYVRTFLVRHNVERYLSSGFDHVRSPLFFLPVIAGGLFPWSLLLPAARAVARSRRRARDLGGCDHCVLLARPGKARDLRPACVSCPRAVDRVRPHQPRRGASRPREDAARRRGRRLGGVLTLLPLGLLVLRPRHVPRADLGGGVVGAAAAAGVARRAPSPHRGAAPERRVRRVRRGQRRPSGALLLRARHRS